MKGKIFTSFPMKSKFPIRAFGLEKFGYDLGALAGIAVTDKENFFCLAMESSDGNKNGYEKCKVFKHGKCTKIYQDLKLLRFALNKRQVELKLFENVFITPHL